VPTGEKVYINSDAVTNVHTVFASESWAEGTQTVVLYGDGLKIGVKEDVDLVIAKLSD